jgi:hypothetical protein
MKTGDILTCITGIKNSSDQIVFTKGQSYMIYEIHMSNWGDTQYYIKDNLGYTGPAFYPNMIKKFFITQQEIRKQKLDKINQTR